MDFMKANWIPANKPIVKNVHWDANNVWLRIYFSGYGNIEDAFLPRNKTTGDKYFGFVRFGREKDAASAIEGTNGRTLE